MRIPLRLVVVSVVLLMITVAVRAQDYDWAARLGGGASDGAGGVAVDAQDNVYTMGCFQGTVDFDPGPGTFNLTAAGSMDTYVSVLDRTGRFVRAGKMGGTAGTFGIDVAIDGCGHLYTVGQFYGTADFDPGPGTYKLTATDDGDGFVSALDSAGNFLWARQFSNTIAYAVAQDAGDRIYTVGRFSGTVDFDPGPGTYTLTQAGTLYDAFVSALDGNGNFVWAAQLGGGYTALAVDVTVDDVGNVYIVGGFRDTADFDPGPGTFLLTSAGEEDAFVSVLDSTGSFVRAMRLGGSEKDYAYGVAVDASGNTYTVGPFAGTADFDPGPGTSFLTSAGGSDVFVSVLDSQGDYVWAARLGGVASDSSRRVAVDDGGRVYSVGDFGDTADFDPGSGTFNLTSAGSDDAFVAVLDSSGGFVWAGQLSGVEDIGGGDIAISPTGYIHVVGGFEGTVDFDPGPATSELTSAGGTDAYVTKLVRCGSFDEHRLYGALLFPPVCTIDASGLTQDVYDSVTVDTNKGPNDRFFLSSADASFAPLVVDDLVYCDGQDSGLGPYAHQPGVPPFIYNAPIDDNLVPEPAHDITPMLPAGPSQLLFELLDTDRAICGNTAVYLLRDCGVWIDEDGGGQTRLNWVSHDVDVGGLPSNLDVASGMLSELGEDGDFSRACNLGTFLDTTQAVDGRDDPPSGDGHYYLVSGTCANPIGYGNSSAGPRQGLPPGTPCP